MHELAHLEVPDHSPAFRRLVDRYPLAERARGFLIAKSFGEDASDRVGTPADGSFEDDLVGSWDPDSLGDEGALEDWPEDLTDPHGVLPDGWAVQGTLFWDYQDS